ncbi:MAG: GNAT family N-acetyltransferase [Planctomycetes bacterium]|nr:GNAT family N-acetyltransferase [Planctomycetota bacterium]
MIFTDLTLARRLEAADATTGAEFVNAFARLKTDRRAAVESIAGGRAMYGGAGSPLTQAVGVGMGGAVDDLEIERLEAFFRDRAEPARLVLCPHADASFVERLGRRGFRLVEFEDMLFRPLVHGETFDPPPGEVAIRRMEPRDAETCLRIVLAGFFEGDAPPPFVEVFRAGFDVEANEFFLAWIGDEPVSGCGMAIRDGLASLFGTSTLPAHRNRGVQTALLNARLARAVAAGCDLATISTKAGTTSQRNAERLGFRVAYTRASLIKEWS